MFPSVSTPRHVCFIKCTQTLLMLRPAKSYASHCNWNSNTSPHTWTLNSNPHSWNSKHQSLVKFNFSASHKMLHFQTPISSHILHSCCSGIRVRQLLQVFLIDRWLIIVRPFPLLEICQNWTCFLTAISCDKIQQVEKFVNIFFFLVLCWMENILFLSMLLYSLRDM